MPSVTIRDVPERVHRELKARAAREGKSLDQYLRERLTEVAARPSMHEVLQRARARVRASGREIPIEAILEARDADRR